jgi:uncharacterized LabA/DUF88 family protein
MYKNPKRKQNLKRFKWLDFRKVGQALLQPGDTLGEIYYCTADVISPPHDPDQSARQQTYLNALVAHSQVTIIKGQFQVRTKKGVPVDRLNHGGLPIEVSTHEEKGTDVNIATLLLRDAFLHACDSAIVISNDSDLALAIETAVQVAGIPVQVISPHLGVTYRLKQAATSNDVLRPRIITACLLPNPVIDITGTHLHKPTRW